MLDTQLDFRIELEVESSMLPVYVKGHVMCLLIDGLDEVLSVEIIETRTNHSNEGGKGVFESHSTIDLYVDGNACIKGMHLTHDFASATKVYAVLSCTNGITVTGRPSNIN